jgi:hypothetical protein
VATTIELRLEWGVFGGQAGSFHKPSDLANERDRFRQSARVVTGRGGAAVVAHTDVRNCFAGISTVEVETALKRLGCDAAEASDVRSFLEHLACEGVEGLPIGPGPSSVLANAVLSSADEELSDRGLVHLRWVDDFYIFTRNEKDGDRAIEIVENTLAGIGLRTAPEKTRLMAEKDVAPGSGASSANGCLEIESRG